MEKVTSVPGWRGRDTTTNNKSIALQSITVLVLAEHRDLINADGYGASDNGTSVAKESGLTFCSST